MFKKILMNRWLISAILLGLVGLFIALKSVWSGFVFVALPFLILFCIYWVVLLILYYIDDYHKNFELGFKEYKAHVINILNVSLEEFEQNLELHIIKYKKSLRLDKFIDICKIAFFISLLFISIFVIFKL